MGQQTWGNDWNKKAKRMRYLDHVSGLLREFYGELKKSGKISESKKAFVEGLMAAGKYVGVTNAEMERLIQKVNHEVFGMSIEQRRKATNMSESVKEKKEETNLDKPTFIRWEKKLSI